jgi:hypothetical protein
VAGRRVLIGTALAVVALASASVSSALARTGAAASSAGCSKTLHAGTFARDRGEGHNGDNYYTTYAWCVRPSELYFGWGDGGPITNIHWTSWGSAKALGNGTYRWGRMGVYSKAKVAITLDQLGATRCPSSGGAAHAYHRMRVLIHKPDLPTPIAVTLNAYTCASTVY